MECPHGRNGQLYLNRMTLFIAAVRTVVCSKLALNYDSTFSGSKLCVNLKHTF